MYGDRVYVPLRAVSESMGADVQWDPATSTAYVDMSEESRVTQVIEQATKYVVGIIGQDKNEKYTEAIIHGTGFLISENGEILTNAHVVSDMETILVVLSDGSGYEATIQCIDEESDIALIKIEAQGLPYGTITAQEVPIGSTAIAIGTPISFSLRNSASKGIVSGVNRGLSSYYRLLQTDATINSGNSGGPLLNLNGEIIGINSVKFAGESVEGLGFSISGDTIRYVLSHFRAYGKVLRPDIGVQFEESWLAKYDLPSNDGLKIIGFANESSGQQQGLKIGDSVLAIGGVKISTQVDYHELTKQYLPGDEAVFKIRRDGVVQDLIITFGGE